MPNSKDNKVVITESEMVKDNKTIDNSESKNISLQCDEEISYSDSSQENSTLNLQNGEIDDSKIIGKMLAERLLKAGGSCNIQGDDSKIPLHIHLKDKLSTNDEESASSNYNIVTTELLTNGGEVCINDDNNETPLHNSVPNNSDEEPSYGIALMGSNDQPEEN